jgi:phosphatidylglycerophosphate synthase
MPVVLPRRPVKSRTWQVSQATANWLANLGASPNSLSVYGMIAGLGGGISLALTSYWGDAQRWLWLAGAFAIQIRLQANLFDGMVAVQTGRASRLRELFNEVPDRVSDTALFVGAGYSYGGDPQLGVWTALAAMFTACVRTTGKTAGAAMVFCGSMAKQHRMAVLTIVCLGCTFRLPPAPDHSGQSLGIVTLGLWLIMAGSLITAVRRLAIIAAQLRVTTQ